MDNETLMLRALQQRAARREERRAFLRTSGTAVVALGGASMLGGCFGGGDDDDDDDGETPTPTPTPTPPPAGVTDADIFNFALNLEYLEAQFYSFAAFGVGLEASLLTGTGTPGTVNGGRQVTFTDPVVRAYAREIAQDEIAHVRFLRRTLGGSAVAQPRLDIGSEPNGAFSSAARAAGLVGANASFDPYASDENFLLGAFIFEDLGVTAYKGASPLITSRPFVEAAAGILAAEAYHAGLIRTVLYAKGVQAPTLRTSADSISNARDALDGPADMDQGITGTAEASNIVPADSNALAYSRTAGQTLNVAYLNRASVSQGGFFPAGVNGLLRASAPN